MPANKHDQLKRKSAQAVNHLAAAILDINDLYVLFAEQHPEDAKDLAQIMLGIDMTRDAFLAFCLKTWNVDEERLAGYA